MAILTENIVLTKFYEYFLMFFLSFLSTYMYCFFLLMFFSQCYFFGCLSISFSLFSHTHKTTTASKFKQVRRGVKEVVKQLKTAREGLCVIAGDISPIDVITHVPMLCEEAGVQYVYVHSKEQLGAAGMTKRPTSVMLVLPKAVKGSVKMGKDDEKEFEEMYKSVHSKVKGMHEK